MKNQEKKPKVFISYKWNGQEKREKIINLVERLAADDVESIVDLYDLNEGDDKYSFMEKMVTDETVTHVLVMCDKEYSEKADNRTAGVGTESLIISQEIYCQTSQSKFIPIICEMDENNVAYMPVFLKSRIYIDFSSPEKENDNWERLIRVIYGKPELQKPTLGKRPSYLDIEETTNTYGMDSKFKSFKDALLSDKKTIPFCRTDFFESCFTFIDSLRIKSQPDVPDFPQKVIDDFKQLVIARNFLVDWCLLESSLKDENLSERLIFVIEILLELSSIPKNMHSFNDIWFEAHKTFAYQCILYFISALIRTENYTVANEVIMSSYKLPSTESYNNEHFCNITKFFHYSEYLIEKLSPSGKRLNSATAELLKINANRSDITFKDVMQADLIIAMFSFINLDIYWYPQTLYYKPYSYQFPFFIETTRSKGFNKLLTLTGVSNKDELTAKTLDGIKVKSYHRVSGGIIFSSFEDMLNINKWNIL